MKKTIVMALAIALVLCMTVGGTLAWLIDSTDPVVNTFTYGDINIDLTEEGAVNNAQSFKMVPGNTITKKPIVTIKANSEACYVFVEIVEAGSVEIDGVTYTFDDFLVYAIAEGWTVLSGTVDKDDSADGNETVVIYRDQEATTTDVSYSVLDDDTVTVNSTVTKQMMEAIKTSGMPTLTFTAYAVQRDNVDSAADAWQIATGTN